MYRRGLSVVRGYAPALPLALACLVGQSLVWFLGKAWSPMALVLLGIVLLIRLAKGAGFILVGLILGVVSGYLALICRPEAIEVDEGIIVGQVTVPPRRTKPGEIVFQLDSSHGRVRCRAIDLPWRNATQIEQGDTIYVRGIFRAVERPINPFAWDAWLWRAGVSAECKALFVSVAIRREKSSLVSVRDWIRTRVEKELGDERGAYLFLSMALGYHDILSEPVEGAFKKLGLTHLLVVSGYQVSLVFGFVMSALALVSCLVTYSRYVRSAVTSLSLVVAGLYVACIGAEMSAIRALLAAGCVCAYLISETGARFAQRWAIALLLMQLVWSWCFFEIGVILTFSALMGIGVGARLGRGRPVASLLWVTVCAWLCTTLVMVMWNGTLSLAGLICNLVLATPWSVVNCAVGLVALAFGLAGMAIGWEVLRCVSWINLQLSELLLRLSELSWISFEFSGVARAGIVAMLLLALVVSVQRSLRHRLMAAWT